MSDPIESIERAMIERYSRRLEEFGADPRTLGWDTRRSQETRFAAALSLVDPKDREVLDIGCGFGDLLAAMKQRSRMPKRYHGIDINPALLEVARKAHPEGSFETRNLMTSPYPSPVCDIGFMFGLLNLKLKDIPNKDYTQDFIRKAWAACREALVVDMLSTSLDTSYPAEDFIHYHDPVEMLRFALTLTPHAALKHDYASIPQREFLLVMRRGPDAGGQR